MSWRQCMALKVQENLNSLGIADLSNGNSYGEIVAVFHGLRMLLSPLRFIISFWEMDLRTLSVFPYAILSLAAVSRRDLAPSCP